MNKIKSHDISRMPSEQIPEVIAEKEREAGLLRGKLSHVEADIEVLKRELNDREAR